MFVRTSSGGLGRQRRTHSAERRRPVIVITLTRVATPAAAAEERWPSRFVGRVGRVGQEKVL